jgi:type II protein arginine methyltransferase
VADSQPNFTVDPTSVLLAEARAAKEQPARDRAYRESLDRLAADPLDPGALRAAATTAVAAGHYAEATAHYDRLIAAQPNDAGLWYDAGKALRAAGDRPRALRHFVRAAALKPGEQRYDFARRTMAAQVVPQWHFSMMNDSARNAAYAEALRRAVTPDRVVLEIGTGAGLLAMLAAQAGAKHVYTCEANPIIAEAAADVVRRNRLSDRITVIPRMSTDVVVGRDLPEPADLLVSEVLSSHLLSEDVLPTIEDAKARLVKPAGTLVPRRVTLRGALVGGDGVAHIAHVGTVMGFDLSRFNDFMPVMMAAPGKSPDVVWMSDPRDLLTFDFMSATRYPPHAAEVAIKATAPGFCHGVVAWMHIDLDGTAAYENRPGACAALVNWHWPPLYYPFAEPMIMLGNETVTLFVAHDRVSIQLLFRRIA